jgi:hypothetical protein
MGMQWAIKQAAMRMEHTWILSWIVTEDSYKLGTRVHVGRGAEIGSLAVGA